MDLRLGFIRTATSMASKAAATREITMNEHASVCRNIYVSARRSNKQTRVASLVAKDFHVRSTAYEKMLSAKGKKREREREREQVGDLAGDTECVC